MTAGPARRRLLHRAMVGIAASGGIVLFGCDRRAPERAARIEHLNSGKVVPATLPFSEAVRVGDMLYLSGQVGIVPGTLTLVPGGIEPEARRTMDNIRTTLQAHGYEMTDLVRCLVMLTDMSEWARFNEIYKTYFSGTYPARSAIGASGLALGARVEVECTAARPSPR